MNADELKMRTGYAGKSQQWQYGFDLACREKQAEIDALKAQRDVAIKHIAERCVAIQQNGAGWDDWDEYYKKACCRDNALPEIRSALNAAIAKARVIE